MAQTIDIEDSAMLGGYDAPCMLPSLSAKIKTCDVYIGLCEDDLSLLRFVNWLRAELQLHGIFCFVADRSCYKDAHAHRLAKDVIDSTTLGIVMITPKTFSSPYGMEELKVFLERGNLVVVFFGLSQEECMTRDIIERRGSLWQNTGGLLWQSYGGLETEWKETVNKLSTAEFKLYAHISNLRDCISDAVSLVAKRLGKKEKVKGSKESNMAFEYPFPRNESFVGREKELFELELALFGYTQCDEYLETASRRSFTLIDRKTADGMHIPADEYNDHINVKKLMVVDHAEKGIACISGESGIGKTELALEFSYRFAQRYKMVLWIGGEARYLCQNYANLICILGIDSSIFFEDNESSSLENLEEQSISRVQKELSRDIPYLIVIDNLESEKEWWHERNIIDILPPLGGSTHIIITTRMPSVMNIKPIRLLYLSAAEALTLMKGNGEDLPVEEVSALRYIEEKVGRVPLGLSIIQAIMSEMPISPTKLLEVIKHTPQRNLTWVDCQDPILMHNRGMIQLLDVCLGSISFFGEHGRLAVRMVQACGWFAPSHIPIPLLVAAASNIPHEDENQNHSWKRWFCSIPCMKLSGNGKLEAKAREMLLRLRVARASTRDGSINFHDIIKLYMRKRGSIGDAHAMVNAVIQHGSPRHHAEHIWAASFLLFNFGSDPGAICLEATMLLDFIRKCVLPLAWDTYTVFLRCGAALELLDLAMKTLEAAKVGRFMDDNAMERHRHRRTFKKRSYVKEDSHLHEELAYVEATLLETFFKMVNRGSMQRDT